MGAHMEGRKYSFGKVVQKKLKSDRKKLPEIIQERISAINQLIEIPINADPNKPSNWYANKELYKKEHKKRLSNLNKAQDLSVDTLKVMLIDAEMVIAYEAFLNQQLLMLHIEGRKAISHIEKHHLEDVQLRKKGVNKKNEPKRQVAQNLINEIGKGSIHSNDFEKFKTRAAKLGLSSTTIRNYWIRMTGFKSTKKNHIN
jgi:hypothetical protein